MGGKYKCGRFIRKRGRTYGLRLNTERQFSWFTYNVCKEKERVKNKAKQKMREGIQNYSTERKPIQAND
jgi:hypothetical protein